MKKSGYITVFLSLILSVLLVLVTTFIELARMQTIRFYTESIMDIALSSVFSEYHRELFHRYGLFAIDTSYGSSHCDCANTKNHLLKYMNRNFKIPENKGKNKIDLVALQADNASFQKISFLTDQQGEVLLYQIVKSMKQKRGLPEFEKISFDFDSAEEQYKDYEEDRERAEERIDEIIEERNQQKKAGEEPVCFENPADTVNHYGESSILKMALSDQENLSIQAVETEGLISNRDVMEGNGLFPYQDFSFGIMERKFYQDYLNENCGDYLHPKEDTALVYQKEYLLYGKGNDNENLDNMVKDIFIMRYVMNTSYLLSSQAKQAEAEALAATLTTAVGNPELAELVKTTLLYAWSYAESVQDIRILLDGKKAAFVKTSSSWNVSLTELFTFWQGLDHYREAENGLDYEAYLNGKLWLLEEKDCSFRLMDLFEMDIIPTEGNQYFRIDQCIYQLEMTANVSSNYGYGYDITRSYSYE